MRIALFCHSLLSDWNHGNAHFLRGVARSLLELGHAVEVLEPLRGWSRDNLEAELGGVPELPPIYRRLVARGYDPADDDLDRSLARLLDGVPLVVVHEWTEPRVVAALQRWRTSHPEVLLLLHDTHHRAVSEPEAIAALAPAGFDAVLAFGESLRRVYLARGWARRAFTWHEAADVALFRPLDAETIDADLVFIGNWGDDERTAELAEYLFAPARALRLSGTVHGVRYPPAGLAALRSAGLVHRGYLPNHRVPEIFARHRLTVHVPRRPYVESLPGIPTIRVFEALACGIPLVSAPWRDSEGLFAPGEDFLVARDGEEMRRHLAFLLAEPEAAAALAAGGRARILARHTCRHRALELVAIAGALGLDATQTEREPACAR